MSQMTAVRNESSDFDHGVMSRRIRILLAAGLLITVGLAVPFPLRGRIWSSVFNLAHAPAFWFVVVLIAGVLHPEAIGLPSRFKPVQRLTCRRLITICFLGMLLGVAGEAVQKVVGRSASLGDVAANTCGITAGGLWVAGYLLPRWMIVCRLATPVILIAASYDPVMEINEAMCQQSEFPLIASFERRRELKAWVPQKVELLQVTEWSTDGSRSMRVIPHSSESAGVIAQWVPANWEGYDSLHIDLHNSGSNERQLILKIADRQHTRTGYEPNDRFEQEIALPPLETVHVNVSLDDVAKAPATRQIDLSHIAILQLFSVNGEDAGPFEIDNIRLE